MEREALGILLNHPLLFPEDSVDRFDVIGLSISKFTDRFLCKFYLKLVGIQPQVARLDGDRPACTTGALLDLLIDRRPFLQGVFMPTEWTQNEFFSLIDMKYLLI